MTGAEHYEEAERLLAGPNPEAYPLGFSGDFERDRADNLAAAQVHATLASAAAVATLALWRAERLQEAATATHSWVGVLL